MIHADETINSKIVFKLLNRRLVQTIIIDKKKRSKTQKIKYNMMGAS